MPKTIISLDTESYYDDEVSVKPLGYYKYARHPQADLYMVSVCDGAEAWAGHPRDFNWDALNDCILLNHNRAHDEEMILAGQEAGRIPKFKPAEWHCTANMSAYLWNQRSLAGAVATALGLEVSKGVRDKAKGKTWEQIVSEGWADDMLNYARLDAQYPHQLWTGFSHRWPEWERRLSNLTIEQGRYGIAIDTVRLDEYISVLQRIVFTATNALPWVARGRAPGSPIGVAEECRASGIPGQPVKSDDEEAAEAWEAEYAPRFPWVMALRNLRKGKKTLAFLETMKARLREDNTIAFSLKYFGAHTGRFSGDAGLSLHNLPRSPFFVRQDFSFELDKKKLKTLEEIWDTGVIPPGVSYAIDIRGLIVARSGCNLAPTDLAQIEPRVLNYTAGNFEMLRRIEGGMAIYEAHARDTMGWTGGELKKEDKPKYNLSKVRLLSFGFGASWEKAILAAAIYGVDLTEGDRDYALRAAVDGKIHLRIKDSTKTWKYFSAPPESGVPLFPPDTEFPGGAEEVIFTEKERFRNGQKEKYIQAQTVYGQRARYEVNDFRTTNPLIPAQWALLQEKLQGAIGGDLVLDLPSGRELRYRDVRRERRKAIDKETGEPYERNVITAIIGGKREITFGSRLGENVTQSIARDVFVHNMLLCEDAGIRTLFTVHDEIVPEVPEGFDASKITQLMSTTPHWLAGCPIAAETKVTKRYLK